MGRVLTTVALHDKSLQKPKVFGPLIGNQERRAFAILLINRETTGRFIHPSVNLATVDSKNRISQASQGEAAHGAATG